MNEGITLQEARLIKQMAWVNMQPRQPNEADNKYLPDAIKMLTLVACLNYAAIDLESALNCTGLYRHENKRAMNRASAIITGIHGEAFNMLCRISTTASRQYNDALDVAYCDINYAVLIEASPDREYNILVALCRLVEKYNKRLSGRYDFRPAQPLYRIPALLAGLNIHDYEIDMIIDKAV